MFACSKCWEECCVCNVKFSETTYKITDNAERSTAIKGIKIIDMNNKPILEKGKRYRITIEEAQDGM